MVKMQVIGCIDMSSACGFDREKARQMYRRGKRQREDGPVDPYLFNFSYSWHGHLAFGNDWAEARTQIVRNMRNGFGKAFPGDCDCRQCPEPQDPQTGG